MKNTQLGYIIDALMQEHEKIFDELRELVYCDVRERRERITQMKEDLNELIDKENAALGVYVDNAEKKVRENFAKIETGIKNISDAIDVKAVREGQQWRKSIQMLGEAIKESLKSEEDIVFHSLEKQYESEDEEEKENNGFRMAG